jgi:hypothetical protein
MPVSLVLAYAVKKYLDKVVKMIFTDNDRFRNHIIIKEVIDSIIVWNFIWGIPPNLIKLITGIRCNY